MRKDPAADTSMAAAGPPSHRAGGQAAADGTQRGQLLRDVTAQLFIF